MNPPIVESDNPSFDCPKCGRPVLRLSLSKTVPGPVSTSLYEPDGETPHQHRFPPGPLSRLSYVDVPDEGHENHGSQDSPR